MGQIKLTPAQKEIVSVLFERKKILVPEGKRRVINKLIEKKVVKWVVTSDSPSEVELTPEGKFMFRPLRNLGAI